MSGPSNGVVKWIAGGLLVLVSGALLTLSARYAVLDNRTTSLESDVEKLEQNYAAIQQSLAKLERLLSVVQEQTKNPFPRGGATSESAGELERRLEAHLEKRHTP